MAGSWWTRLLRALGLAGPARIDPQTFVCKVAGTSRKNPDGTCRRAIIMRHCRPGVELVARREPDNPSDPGAIALYVAGWHGRESQVGYLPGGLAADLGANLDEGGSFRVAVAGVTGGVGRKPCGVDIAITVTPAPRPPG